MPAERPGTLNRTRKESYLLFLEELLREELFLELLLLVLDVALIGELTFL